VKNNQWVIGAQDGNGFADNSKYFYQYISQNHKEIEISWISQDRKTINSIKKLGPEYKAYLNLSITGIYKILTAENYIFSNNTSDILFAFKKKGRKYTNLWHGMPLKKIVYDHQKYADPNNLNYRIWNKFAVGFKHEDVNYIFSTSELFVPFLKSAFRNENIFITGQPRMDTLKELNPNNSQLKERLKINPGTKIISYLPTHRLGGKGKPNPFIFNGNREVNEWLKLNDVIILQKNHRLMVLNHDLQYSTSKSDNIIDISTLEIDTQELLAITDILITDYSSVFVDFMVLNRPILFYIYDNYTVDDNELYFDFTCDNIGTLCYNELDLAENIKQRLKYNSPEFIPEILNKYHNTVDKQACDRIFNVIAN
jgi:CDP-glycerol glycerophosphotransferase (TagB/SpsB family)